MDGQVICSMPAPSFTDEFIDFGWINPYTGEFIPINSPCHVIPSCLDSFNDYARLFNYVMKSNNMNIKRYFGNCIYI